jgi:sugar phosphate isomerase/epimerase
MEIFCSTGGFKTRDFFESSQAFLENGIRNIELSAGTVRPDFRKRLKQLNTEANLMLHNYFPPANDPLVLNLASLDNEIANRSIDFYRELIRLSASISSRYVGIHAGLLLDPKVNELGKVIKPKELFPRDQALNLFYGRIEALSRYASNLEVRLLVENNILSKGNFDTHGKNILLLADEVEIAEFMTSLGGKLGLLLDVGHLKVSSNTLQFDLVNAFQLLEKFTEGYHLSENLGESDDHFGFSMEAWFIPLLNPNIAFGTLEISNLDAQGMAKLSETLSEHLGNRS